MRLNSMLYGKLGCRKRNGAELDFLFSFLAIIDFPWMRAISLG